MTDPRYPIGTFERRDTLTPDERQTLIAQLAAAPARMREAVSGLNDEQLDTPYRDGGWSARQVVHHVPDSHLNAYCRLKITLSEENSPTIRPYDEAAWATLPDMFITPIDVSLTLLESLHARWVGLWSAMKDEDFARTFNHPEHGIRTLDWLLALYGWHSRHHVAHITSLRERMGW
jgi:uncharacterized damage-inducible protein DinB